MNTRIPTEKRPVHDEVSALISSFGEAHLDGELTGFALELWARVCRTSKLDARRGRPGIWAAAVVHVIARMNFCYDRKQPVCIKLDTISSHFDAAKNTLANKATEIEKVLKLRGFVPGLSRPAFGKMFQGMRLPEGLLFMFAASTEHPS